MTILFVRHGQNDWLGKGLAGRTPGVTLNHEGREEAARVAALLAARPVRAIYSSPMERALETAAPLGELLGLEVRIDDDLNELNFGDWSGKAFEALDQDPRWSQFNRFRSATRAPGGELMAELQARMGRFCARQLERHPDGEVVAVSHADPIRTALMHFLGMPLDFYGRLVIDPASVTALELDAWGARLAWMNLRP